MIDPTQLMIKAGHSGFYRFLLNVMLNRIVPFNKPHGFKVIEITKEKVKILIPYKKRNLNHIRGLHATALATLSEFTTGLMLLKVLGAKKYRIILQKLEIEYHYQGKTDATAEFIADDSWFEEKVYSPLTSEDKVVVPCRVNIHDVHGNHLTSAVIYWQIKPWNKVKTKVQL